MKKNIVRRLVQFLSIFLFFFFLKKTGAFPVSEKLPLSIYYQLDGLLTISVIIMTGTIGLLMLPGILFLLFIGIIGNFFCWWVCPLGGIIDYLNLVTLRKQWKITLLIPKWLRNGGLIILMIVILSAIFSGFLSLPFIGFVFDPFVIMGQAATRLKLWVGFFGIIIVTAIMVPRLWCNCFCPLGRLYTLTGTKIRLKKLTGKLTKKRHE
ncbi:MAG TPA: 4Fe-4S binding protein [bacterium]|nr:4Fe-4S binding protein [bacterium]HOL34364.1 4Fe-4S binding protein [bacterium]HPP07501.1 4Fe-4S binding protein [bacterium]